MNKEKLDTLFCRIVIPNYTPLMDREEFSAKLTKEAVKQLIDWKIKAEKIPYSAEGGGFGGSFWDLLNLLWDNGERISLIFIVLSWIIEKIKVHLIGKSPSTHHRAVLFLEIKTNSSYGRENDIDLDGLVSERLIEIKNLADALCKKLTEKYPMLTLDQDISVSIFSKSFKAQFSLPQERQTTFNKNRLNQIFSALNVKNNIELSFDFGRLFITRTDRETKFEDGEWLSGNKSRKCFLIISPKLIGE